MDKKLCAFRLEPDTKDRLKRIANTLGIDNTKAVSMLIDEYGTQKLPSMQETLNRVDHELLLLKKYSNEIRRNNYLILNLLNAMCIEMQIGSAPDHRDKTFQSPAFQEATQNLKQFMLDVKNQIASFSTSEDGDPN